MKIHYRKNSKILKHARFFNNYFKKRDNFYEFPVTFEVHPSIHCNFNCVFCRYEKKKTNMMIQDLPKVLTNLNKSGIDAIIFSGGGEPTLHSELWKSILNCDKDMGLFTNASVVLPHYNQFKFVRVSLNASNQDEFTKISSPHNFTFEDILEHISQIRKSDTILGINYILTRLNTSLDSLQRITNIAKKLKIDYLKFNRLVESVEYGLSFDDDKIMDYLDVGKLKVLFGDLSVFPRAMRSKECHMIKNSFSGFLAADGNLYPCIYLYEKKYSFGNIYEDDFETIWFGKRRREVIDRINTRIHCPNYCRFHKSNREFEMWISLGAKKWQDAYEQNQLIDDPHQNFL